MFKPKYKIRHNHEHDFGNVVSFEKVKNLANEFNYHQKRSLEAEFDKWVEKDKKRENSLSSTSSILSAINKHHKKPEKIKRMIRCKRCL